MAQERTAREAKSLYTDKDWAAFSSWEREYKRSALRSLTPQKAFEVFAGLWELARIDRDGLEALRMKRIDHLVEMRRRLAVLQGASL
ncbi:MAG: hypothetical protein GXO65_00580 [Euryarchaeota archaeon]|nr:hypothetical protein [Euryarchaeota archaeon]